MERRAGAAGPSCSMTPKSLRGWIAVERAAGEGTVRDHADRMDAWVNHDASLKDALATMLQWDAGWVAVLDGDRFLGVLTPVDAARSVAALGERRGGRPRARRRRGRQHRPTALIGLLRMQSKPCQPHPLSFRTGAGGPSRGRPSGRPSGRSSDAHDIRSITIASPSSPQGCHCLGGGDPAAAGQATRRSSFPCTEGQSYAVSCPSSTFCAATDDAKAMPSPSTGPRGRRPRRWASCCRPGWVRPPQVLPRDRYVGGFTVWNGRAGRPSAGPDRLGRGLVSGAQRCFRCRTTATCSGYSARGSWSELPPGEFTAAGLTCTARYFVLRPATDTNGTVALLRRRVVEHAGAHRKGSSATSTRRRASCRGSAWRSSGEARDVGYDGSGCGDEPLRRTPLAVRRSACATSSSARPSRRGGEVNDVRRVVVDRADGGSGGDGARSISVPTSTFCMACRGTGRRSDGSNGSWTVTGFDT